MAVVDSVIVLINRNYLIGIKGDMTTYGKQNF